MPPAVIQSFWDGPITAMEKLCMKSFLANGHPFVLYVYGQPPEGIPADVVVKDANEILPKAELGKFRYIQQASDLFRVKMLLQLGGWYTDMDMVCLRPWDFDEDYVFNGIDNDLLDGTIQNSVMKVPKNSPLMQYWYDYIQGLTTETKSGLAFEALGPQFISQAILKFGLQKFVKNWKFFDPIGWRRISQIIDPTVQWDLGSSYGVHLFHAAWRKNKATIPGIYRMEASPEAEYPAGCIYETLKRRFFETPKVSIIMTTFNRAPQLLRTLESITPQSYKDFEVVIVDDGNDKETPVLMQRQWPFPIKYFRLNRPKVGARSGPAVAINFGVRRATGEIVVVQNAECRHVGEILSQLISTVKSDNVVLCQTDHFDESGKNLGTVVDIKEARFAYFFCGAIYKAWICKLRGFDEDFNGVWGGEDDDFSYRLHKAGVKFHFLNDKVQHQWHSGCLATSENVRTPEAAVLASKVLYEKKAALDAGKIGVVRNLDHDWGCPSANFIPKLSSTIKTISPNSRAIQGSEIRISRGGHPRYAKDGCTIDWFDLVLIHK